MQALEIENDEHSYERSLPIRVSHETNLHLILALFFQVTLGFLPFFRSLHFRSDSADLDLLERRSEVLVE